MHQRIARNQDWIGNQWNELKFQINVFKSLKVYFFALPFPLDTFFILIQNIQTARNGSLKI